MPDKEVAVWQGHVIKAANKGLFGGLIEIDHDISAEDQVKGSAELDRIHQVEGSEDHVVPDLRGDREGTVRLFGKILALPGGGKF